MFVASRTKSPPAALSPFEQAEADAQQACAAVAGRSAQLVERYARAVEREFVLRGEWEGLGRPVVALGGATGRTEVVHPLIARIEAAEAHAQRLAAEIGLLPGSRKGVMGRPQERVVAHEESEPPRIAKLRSVS